MKITRLNLHHLRMTLRTPFETSFGRSETRDCILIEAHAGDLIAMVSASPTPNRAIPTRPSKRLAHHPRLPRPGNDEPGPACATAAARAV